MQSKPYGVGYALHNQWRFGNHDLDWSVLIFWVATLRAHSSIFEAVRSVPPLGENLHVALAADNIITPSKGLCVS